ncbi:zinc finger protein 84-like [Pogonomyrmex barbatus]|uniref:Zinc finger protein 84-like n=1 Tax=Pogonomyrmex barbatus TaxID=144034 RepID=A0A6I9WET1_9HYME|nr:zinc finger protein 84-like [Pogonomyrmex barbatus]
MRIKTAPKHRILQRTVRIASRSSSDEESVTDVERKNYDSIDTIDRQNLYQAYTSPSKILLPIRKFTSSNNEMTLSSSTGLPSLINDDNNNVEVMNLSTKDASNHVDDITTDTSAEPEDKLKDSFLYKIMTDPNFLKNIQRNKQPKKFVCLFCKEEFATCEELTSHMDAKKNDSNQIACCACKKTFAEKRYLKYHQRCHSDRTKFTCDICTKKYTRLDNLTRHNVLHVNPDKFSCTICNKTFTRKDLLNKHRKSHEKCNLYCVKCGKYFRSIFTLENHQKTHREGSNASANIVVYKTENLIPTENLICKTENSVSENKVYETHDSTLDESLVCKTEDITHKT